MFLDKKLIKGEKMKIVRFQTGNYISYGILEEDKVKRIEGSVFSEYNITEEDFLLEDIELLSPVVPPNIIAIGLNYRSHAEESGLDNRPERPVIFLKATSSVIGPEEDIILPAIAPEEVDYEAELAVIIGKRAKDIGLNEVEDYILGYTCANDVSARDCQLRLDKQWARGKSFDTFCPLGPWIETELQADNCKIETRLNGKTMQSTNTADMIFGIKELVSYCSKNMTLLPGTVILTGTPEGVGFARKPPVFLRPGDKIEVTIEGIGTLTNQVRM